jgi:transposase
MGQRLARAYAELGQFADSWRCIAEGTTAIEKPTLQIDKLVTGDGCPLPLRLAREITREIARLALIQEQIATLERERDQAPTPCKATEKKRVQLMSLTGIAPAIAAVMTREVYYANLPTAGRWPAFSVLQRVLTTAETWSDPRESREPGEAKCAGP